MEGMPSLHVGTTDELYYQFATEWLFPEHQKGTYLIRTEDVVPFVEHITEGRVASGRSLSEYGLVRAARDLLRMAADFGLLTGSARREFAPYHLSERTFLYVLHALNESEKNARRSVESPLWRLFLMSPDDVERALLDLHQYRKLEYHVAGSLAQLRLPCSSLLEYVRTLTA